MASAGAPGFPAFEEKANYARLCCLLVDFGSQALRDTFDAIHPSEGLHTVLGRHPEHVILQSLRKKRVLNRTQWGKLYPTLSSSVSSADFDIRLLMVLLRCICGLDPPDTGWDNLPSAEDISREANIARVRYYCNTVHGHASQASVDDARFNSYWQDINIAIEGLAGAAYGTSISKIKNECMDPDTAEHYSKLLKQWKEDEGSIQGRLEESGGKIRRGYPINDDSGDPPECSVHLPDLSDLPSAGTDQCPSQPDVLLLTVQDCEFLSCYAYLQNPLKHYFYGLGYVYFGIIGDEEHEHVRVALLKCHENSVGPGSSLITVKDAVTSLQPRAVISVGYCSGLNREKAKLGDVVVCTKLTTYASKIVLDTEQQSTGTRTVITRNFLSLVKNVADGWKAPLKSPGTQKVEVHKDSEFLSGPERINADWRRAELLEAYPMANAIDLEGEGVFTAAFDLGIEWLLVKGIADFADGTNTNSPLLWKRFASVMAASVVYHLLSDPNVFKNWPRYKESTRAMLKRSGSPIGTFKEEANTWQNQPSTNENPRVGDGFDPTEITGNIRQLYKNREGTMNLLPWCEHLNFSFRDFYTRLKVIYKEKTRGTATERIVTMSEIFNSHEECEEPRVVLIEGKPGMGKTTYCKKIVFDWATQERATGNYFAKFLIVLLIKCREAQSDLWGAIDDQLLPRDVDDDQRKRFFDFVRRNQSEVLLVLDGLDEVSKTKLPMFSDFIQGRVLPKCRVVVTARHEAGVKVRKYCNTLLEVEGFTEGDVKTFIEKYFRTNPGLAKHLIKRLHDDKTFYEMSANPLNIALLCLVYEDLDGVFPESRSKLYMDIVECVLRRYRAKKQLSEDEEDLLGLYESQLNHLGSIASKGLLEDNLDFDEKELGKHKSSDLPGLGFLSVQPGGSKLRPTRRYGFLHKTFQEFFAALHLCCQLIKKEISNESIAVNERYRYQLKEVLRFTFGIVAARCEETAVNLLKSIATQLNQEDRDEEAANSMKVILECIYECKNDNNFDEKLACIIGPCLQIEALDVSLVGAKALLLTNVLTTNTSLRELCVGSNKLGDGGAAALAQCLKENASLTNLDLYFNDINEAGTAALAECLEKNTSLTKLDLSGNRIGSDGAAALGECLKKNKSLRELVLATNSISDDCVAALADGLKESTSLTKLHLELNHSGDAGAAALAECLKKNTSLTDLNLGSNEIGNDGAASLAECLKQNTSLTGLNLSRNDINNNGAAALADCLRNKASINSSMAKLSLELNQCGDAGAAALAECLKENTSLRELNLACCEIGNDGATALAGCLKENTSLVKLNLGKNYIADAGAAALAGCLKGNTSLIELNLAVNKINDGGAVALAECLKENTSLTELNLVRNHITDAGAAALAGCLKENESLTELHLGGNEITDDGSAALAECLRVDTFLTESYWP